jgi:hypothetical protein
MGMAGLMCRTLVTSSGCRVADAIHMEANLDKNEQR